MDRMVWCGVVGVGLAVLVGCSPRPEARVAAARTLECDASAVKLEPAARKGDERSFIAECHEFHQPPPVLVTCKGKSCEQVEPCPACLEERRTEMGVKAASRGSP